jgi:hypothetical protein
VCGLDLEVAEIPKTVIALPADISGVEQTGACTQQQIASSGLGFVDWTPGRHRSSPASPSFWTSSAMGGQEISRRSGLMRKQATPARRPIPDECRFSDRLDWRVCRQSTGLVRSDVDCPRSADPRIWGFRLITVPFSKTEPEFLAFAQAPKMVDVCVVHLAAFWQAASRLCSNSRYPGKCRSPPE